MNRHLFYTLLSHIATGVSLFVGIGGAAWAFFTYLKFSLITAVAAAIIGLVPGLFMLLISEGLFVLLRILSEKEKQTELLISIDNKLGTNTSSSPAEGGDENLPDH